VAAAAADAPSPSELQSRSVAALSDAVVACIRSPRAPRALNAYEIETTYGGTLDWQPVDGKRACRIRERFEISGYRDEDRWIDVQDAMIDGEPSRMAKFSEADRHLKERKRGRH